MDKVLAKVTGRLGAAFYGLALILSVPFPAFAEVIAIPNGEDGGVPTLTLFWESADAKATLVLIPGGTGKLNLKPTQTDTRSNFYQSLKALTEASGNAGGINVVLFDSPQPLDPNPKDYPWSRASKDHLSRISSVIRFYKQKTEKPIWLMGHSNGAVSITEFIRFNDPERAPSLLSGLVVSGARNGTRFAQEPLKLPILFLHHEKDGCRDADPNKSMKNFEQVRETDRAPTEFRFITGGESQAKSPCESGYHMYNGAEMKMDEALRNFILSNLP